MHLFAFHSNGWQQSATVERLAGAHDPSYRSLQHETLKALRFVFIIDLVVGFSQSFGKFPKSGYDTAIDLEILELFPLQVSPSEPNLCQSA